MEYDFEIYKLSEQFLENYPLKTYPELLHKSSRPYTCLLVDLHIDYFICIPFRSDIQHKNSYLFKNSERSRRSRSGLDYSKMVIVKNTDYLDSTTTIDNDEYIEVIKNLPLIVNQSVNYLETYCNHVSGKSVLSSQKYKRDYQYSTLPYFHEILKIWVYFYRLVFNL